MHFKTLSAICFNFDQSNILLSGNGLSEFLGKKDFFAQLKCNIYTVVYNSQMSQEKLLFTINFISFNTLPHNDAF